jgi:glutamate-1-semialdehyde 2,1-aminomutase
VGAYAGKRGIMEHVAPVGTMYQAGTLSGNPLAMTAGLVTIREWQPRFDEAALMARKLITGIMNIATSYGVPIQANLQGTMFGFYFLKEDGAIIRDYATAKQFADTERYAVFFHAMLAQGVYFAPSQFEAGFMSAVHSEADIEKTVSAIESAFKTF